MDLRKLKTLIDLVQESGIEEIELTEEGDRVRIVNSRRGAAPAPVEAAPASPAVPAPQAKAEAGAAGKPVVSPMVGTFFAAPSPGAKPFVAVGDKVKAGQTLCIIEAMKLLNEIEAETDGTVLEICVKNAEPVEFGQTLFLIG